MAPRPLVIFDFSGTLSLGAVDFGLADRLVAHLRKWGLDAMGVGTAELYWEQIAGPTWSRASTSPVGYKAMMTDAVMALAGSRWPRDRVNGAVSGFVDDYLAASVIDPRWRPVLRAVQKKPGAVGVVATDHYAEATPAIIAHLRSIGIAATSLAQAGDGSPDPPMVVACSADVGYVKSEDGFWMAVANRLPAPVSAVMIVDDFGANEQPGSEYGHNDKCRARRRRTAALLQQVFAAPVSEAVFFVIRNRPNEAGHLADAIEAACRQVLTFLDMPHENDAVPWNRRQ